MCQVDGFFRSTVASGNSDRNAKYAAFSGKIPAAAENLKRKMFHYKVS